MVDILPPDILQGATLRGDEYGWSVSSFPRALVRAEAQGYACLGGQFQFRLEDATCEMYWLNPDSNERKAGESWADYSHRSCSEVLDNFQHLATITDFKKVALAWPLVQINTINHLVFVAYFVTEFDLTSFIHQ